MKAPSQAQLLQEAVDEARVSLSHDAQHRAFVRFPHDGHVETWPLRSADFRRFISLVYYRHTGLVVRREVLAEQLEILAARAVFEGPREDVHVRIAPTAEGLVLDLGGADWSVIEIDASGWRWQPTSAAHLVRPNGLGELPTPESGGSLDALRPFLNIGDDPDLWRLLIGFLLALFHPTGPYPVLAAGGEQGAAKSTTTRVLRMLIDPRDALDRTTPRDERDLAVHAQRNRVIALDNVSSLPDWLSDALARLATGAGFSTRQLYSDDEEITFHARRPIMVNGIGSIVTRSDLLDRALIVSLPVIEPADRREEETFWRDFRAAQPHILGALLTAVSAALANRDTVRLASVPRMADFARWVTAAEPALGWEPGAFVASYYRNRGAAHEMALEADPLAGAVIELLRGRTEWVGTPSALLQLLSDLVGDGQSRQRGWPKAAHSMSNRLQRLAPNLRAVGIFIENLRTGQARQLRLVRTDNMRNGASLASSASSRAWNRSLDGDARDAAGDARDAAGDAPRAGNGAIHAQNDARDANDAPMQPLSEYDDEAEILEQLALLEDRP